MYRAPPVGRLLGLFVPLLLWGCAASSGSAGTRAPDPNPTGGPRSAPQAQVGPALIGSSSARSAQKSDEHPAVRAAPLHQILAISPEMREFVARHVRNAPAEGSRLRRLLKGMIDEGYLDLVYDTDLTHNARTTFEQRNGNCLSFTLLFVALAREANLDARFQIVDIPPVWESEGQWVILDKHINVVLPDIQAEANFTRDYVVDFNVDDYRGNYDRRQVDDEHAFALYYSNLGVEALQSGQVDDAQALFEKSLTLNDRIPATWVNIGALRATTGDFDAALNAYQTALEVNPGDRSALVNMAGMLSELGREEEAARYERRVRYYRNRNPYFHYSLSLVAYEQGNWDDALKKINRALHLKREEHQFHLLKALIGYRMDNVAMAERSLTRAMNLAEQTSIKQRYARKLQALATVSSR